MKNILEKVDQNAGKVWRTLDEYGPCNQNKLMKITKLNNEEFYAAVGWLACENKIYNDGTLYKLGDTNLVEKIGPNAGKIWTMLNEWGKVDAPYISKITGLTEKDTSYALGWLAQEGKINVRKVKPTKYQIIYELK